MYKRVNITLSEDALGRADAFAERERYSRSGLIAAALEEFIDQAESVNGVVRERYASYTGTLSAPAAARTLTAPTLDEVTVLLGAFFAARDDVEAAWVFGSVARGESGPSSDIDVAVLPKAGMDVASRNMLALDLSARLSSVLGRNEVDVVCLSDAPVRLAHGVVVDGRIVYEESRTRVAEVELSAIRAFVDFEPVIREAKRLLRERTVGYARL